MPQGPRLRHPTERVQTHPNVERKSKFKKLMREYKKFRKSGPDFIATLSHNDFLFDHKFFNELESVEMEIGDD